MIYIVNDIGMSADTFRRILSCSSYIFIFVFRILPMAAILSVGMS